MTTYAPYRKIWAYFAGMVLVMLNDFFGFGLDETQYLEGARQVFDLLIMILTGVMVYQARNDPKTPR